MPKKLRGVVVLAIMLAGGSAGGFAGGCAQQAVPIGAEFYLQPGDLLFQDVDGSPLCEAIETVTFGCRGAKFTHVGLVCHVDPGAGPFGLANDSQKCQVLEAVSAGVKVTSLGEFLQRSQDDSGRPKVAVGRLRSKHQALIPAAIEYGLSLVGKPYDKTFELDNDAYYCSELVFEAIAHADIQDGQSLFQPQPMTFTDPATGQTFPAWEAYFAELGAAIPQGQPGINPGGMSRSTAIKIVHLYGIPTGWED